jgi:hypothetical protein
MLQLLLTVDCWWIDLFVSETSSTNLKMSVWPSSSVLSLLRIAVMFQVQKKNITILCETGNLGRKFIFVWMSRLYSLHIICTITLFGNHGEKLSFLSVYVLFWTQNAHMFLRNFKPTLTTAWTIMTVHLYASIQFSCCSCNRWRSWRHKWLP